MKLKWEWFKKVSTLAMNELTKYFTMVGVQIWSVVRWWFLKLLRVILLKYLEKSLSVQLNTFFANVRIALSKFEAVCPDRWNAASQNWVTQRFKKDTFMKDRNFLKLANSCNPLTSFEVKKAMFITLISFLASISLNFDLNFLHFSIEIEWNNCQILFPIEKTFQMRYWRS